MAWQHHSRSNRVYVSYSWEADKGTPVVDEIGELLAQHGLELRRDKEQVKYGDSIKSFMDEIGAADNIVPVLSRQYFHSEFCMYELLHVWNHGNFGTRVHPIALPDFELAAWRTQLDLVKFWNKEAAELQRELTTLTAAQTLNLIERLRVIGGFSARIDELLAFLADLNITPRALLRDQEYAPLLDRIKPSKPPQRRHRKADSEFLNRIRTEVQKLLDRHPRLSALLLAEAQVAFPDDRRDLSAILFEAPPEVAIADILHPGTKACLTTSDAQGDFQNTWHAAKQVLGWMCLLAVDPEWITRIEEKAEAGRLELRILVKTLTAVEVGIAHFNQVAASFSWEKGRAQVPGYGHIPLSPLEPGWGFDAAVRGVQLEFWNRVFPLDERKVLDEDALELLNEELLRVVKHDEGQYYVTVKAGDGSPLDQREVYDRLLAGLPAAMVIYLDGAAGEPALIMGSETKLLTAIRGFLGIPDSLRAGQ